MKRLVLFLFAVALIAAAPSPFLSDWTSPDLTRAIKAGTITTVIIPTGGTEDNGADLPLGKHNEIVRESARRLAQRLGHAVVAPPMAYVPESRHAKAAGTLSLSSRTFEAVLNDTIVSLVKAGVHEIIIIGDSNENQKPQAHIAARMDRKFRRHGVRVWHLGRYYTGNGQAKWLKARGVDPMEATRHAGLADRAEYAASTGRGDAKLRALGAGLLTLKVEAAVAEVERLRKNK